MSRILNIDVTQEDIDRGIRNSERCCPIAWATCRELGDDSADVRVTHGITVTGYYFAYLPEKALEFVEGVDNLHNVKPFRFTVSLDEQG